MASTQRTGADSTPNSSGGFGEWARLHLWQIQPIRDVLLLLAVFGLIILGYKASIVTVPLLLALMLAYLFEPVVRRIARGNPTRRKLAAGGLILSVLVFVVVLAAACLPA